MNRWKKIAFALVLIGVIAISSSLVWLTAADIGYAFNMDYLYKKNGDEWMTVNWINETQMTGTFVNINCVNRGFSTGSFDLLVTFTNATVTTTTTEPYELVNSTTAKVSYRLRARESHSIDVYFTIDDDVRSFVISLWFESSQLFIRSREGNWLGINTLYYEHFDDENSFVANAVN